MIKTLLAAAAVIAPLALPAHAVTLVQWDFETPPADLTDSAVAPSVAASLGAGTASGVHASSGTDWTTPTGNGSANSLSANSWAIGDYFQFSFSTTGYKDMVLSFDQTSSNTGPRDFTLAYSSDGVSFTNFASYSILANASPNAWTSGTYLSVHTYNFDLSSISSLDNTASVVVRLVDASTVAANGGVVAAGGTDRIDNFTVNMAPVPEPGTTAMLLAGLACLGFIARRRRG